MGDLSENFSSVEFACPCCGQSNMDSDFIEKLQKLRDKFNMPFNIVEGGGYRCDLYGGVGRSAHKEGKAVDLAVASKYYYYIIHAAMNLGFEGIGVKNKNSQYQIHLDTAEAIDGIRPRPWIWTY